MNEINEITACRILEGFNLELTFADGYRGVIDFGGFVQQTTGVAQVGMIS